MANRIRKTLSALYNGVSQQSPIIRLDSQCREQINAVATIERGLEKRPGTELVSVLSATNIGNNSKLHKINRDANEKYLVVFTDDVSMPIEVYGLDGAVYPVVYDGAALTYCTSTTPVEQMRALTVADYTLIANRSITCLMDSAVDPTPTPFAIVWIKQGYDGDYRIEIDGTGVVDALGNAKTEEIATDLASKIAALGGGATYDVENLPSTTLAESSVFRVTRQDGSDFSISGSDPLGNTGMLIAKGSVKDINDLPPHASEGDLLKVRSDKTNDGVNLYFKWNDTDGDWVESRNYGIEYAFDASTLPHQMVRLQDDGAGTVTGTPNQIYFQVSTIAWEDRSVGDNDTVPQPSFIGSAVEDVFWFEGRFGLLTSNNIVTSKANDFWNFWATTALEALDDDPVDLGANTSEVVSLRHAVPFSDALLAFGEVQQFSLTAAGSSPFTPSSATLQPTTNIRMYSNVQPAKAGPNVYFAGAHQGYTQLFEYFVEPDTLLNDAADVTSHVPRYVEQNIRALISDSNGESVYALGASGSTDMYVYKYFWQGNEKVQSAWSKWTFDDVIIAVEQFESTLYFVFKAGSEVRIEKMSENPDHLASTNFVYHLDRLTNPDSIAVNGAWIEVTMPYALDGTEVLIDSGGLEVEGVENLSTYVLRFPYDSGWSLTTTDYYVGKPYTMTYTLSDWVPKEGNAPVIDGFVQVKSVEINHEDTGYYQYSATSTGKPTLTQTFSPNIASLSLDTAVVVSGERRFQARVPAKGATIKITSDKHYPVRVTAISLDGVFKSRARYS